MKIKWLLWMMGGVCILALLFPTADVFAHGGTKVGDYQVEIGFRNEPAIQDQPNGLELVVTNTKTGKLVAGLESTLQAEIIFGVAHQTLKIEPEEGQPGSYTAFIIPTQAGDYTWHITGKIENTPVDISMTSGPTTFASVEPVTDYAFPGREVSVASLRTELNRTRLTAILGLILGAIGLLVGAVSLWLTVTHGRISSGPVIEDKDEDAWADDATQARQ